MGARGGCPIALVRFSNFWYITIVFLFPFALRHFSALTLFDSLPFGLKFYMQQPIGVILFESVREIGNVREEPGGIKQSHHKEN